MNKITVIKMPLSEEERAGKEAISKRIDETYAEWIAIQKEIKKLNRRKKVLFRKKKEILLKVHDIQKEWEKYDGIGVFDKEILTLFNN